MSTRPPATVREDFAGPGGWSEALKILGLHEQAEGIEFDAEACATAAAAGHVRMHRDVRGLRSEALDRWPLLVGYIASPPCQTFSKAGGGKGLHALDDLRRAVTMVAAGALPEVAVASLRDTELDERSLLVLEPLLVVGQLRPQWVALEQVPGVLPIWDTIGEAMQGMGYHVATGFVHSEQYGVPQTRKRAVLVAHQDRRVALPKPTHSKFHSHDPARMDPGVLPWVSMAEALGWGMHDVAGFPRLADRAGREVVEIDGVEYRAADLRLASLPGQTVTEKIRSWTRYSRALSSGRWPGKPATRGAGQPALTVTGGGRNVGFEFVDDVYYVNGNQDNAATRRADAPAPTILFGHRLNATEWQVVNRAEVVAEVEPRVNNQSGTPFDLEWPADRPSPVVAGRELVMMPGANANRFNGSTKSRNDGVKVTIAEAGVLQSFRADYPWQGNKTKQFEQVGNCVPPLMGAAIIRALLTEEREYDTTVLPGMLGIGL